MLNLSNHKVAGGFSPASLNEPATLEVFEAIAGRNEVCRGEVSCDVIVHHMLQPSLVQFVCSSLNRSTCIPDIDRPILVPIKRLLCILLPQ